MILSNENIKSILDKLKADNKKIVFTNGCFDILHRGHAAYLNQAKTLGDILIVGINSDKSVRGLKGEGRPVNNETDRAFLIGNLKSVDYTVIFDEETPYNLIKEILPDFLVKGGDWKEEDIVGWDIVKKYDGKVLSLNFIENYSTTNTLKKLQKSF